MKIDFAKCIFFFLIFKERKIELKTSFTFVDKKTIIPTWSQSLLSVIVTEKRNEKLWNFFVERKYISSKESAEVLVKIGKQSRSSFCNT